MNWRPTGKKTSRATSKARFEEQAIDCCVFLFEGCYSIRACFAFAVDYTFSMPRLDIIHDAVKNALIKDGWVITEDPFIIEYRNDEVIR
jgi:hypothetical protein